MPIDPKQDALMRADSDPGARAARTIGDLERRVAALEHGYIIRELTANTAPVRDGTPAWSGPPATLWVRVRGAWRFVALS